MHADFEHEEDVKLRGLASGVLERGEHCLLLDENQTLSEAQEAAEYSDVRPEELSVVARAERYQPVEYRAEPLLLLGLLLIA